MCKSKPLPEIEEQFVTMIFGINDALFAPLITVFFLLTDELRRKRQLLVCCLTVVIRAQNT